MNPVQEYGALSKDVSYDLEKFKDPYVVGAMIHRLVEERKLTNVLMKSIEKKLDQLVRLHGGSETQTLSDVDARILEYVKKEKSVCALDLAKALHYKGSNGASARLSALSRQGLVRKSRAGKKVLYSVP